jgi:hypothetical protein
VLLLDYSSPPSLTHFIFITRYNHAVFTSLLNRHQTLPQVIVLSDQLGLTRLTRETQRTLSLNVQEQETVIAPLVTVTAMKATQAQHAEEATARTTVIPTVYA